MRKRRQERGAPATRRAFVQATALGLGGLLVPGVVGTRQAAAAAPEESTIDRIKRAGVFNLGVRDADPPYGYLDKATGKHVGFSTEIAEKVHERLERELKTKLKVNYVPVTGRTRIPLLLNNTIDMEAGATVITKERERVVDFSVPFFLTATFLLVPADSPIRRIADLSGKRVGGHRGGLEEGMYTKRLAKEFRTPVRFIGFENHSEGFTALQGGSIDAYSSDGPLLYGLQRKAPEPGKWKVFDPGVNAFAQAFPMRENSSAFANVVNLTVVEACESGAWQELYQKYFVPTGLPKELDDTLRFLLRFNSWD
jgi:ABC-type amino acid transport substrate-binding protein